jgi:hypothetical protein
VQGSRGRRATAVVSSLVLVSALVSGVPRRAFAEKEPTVAELTAARELFGEGVKLEEAHEWAAALERFRAVAAVKKTAAVHFHLGLCLENTGKLVEALDNFQRASDGAALDATPDGALIGTKSKKHLAELGQRIPRLVLRADPPLEELHVSIDGVEVEVSVAAKGIPLDPGKHVVAATAPGHLPYETKIELFEKAPPREILLALAVDPEAKKPRVLTMTPLASTETGRGAWPWVFGAVSLASFATAGVMYGLRASAISELEGACNGGHTDCPPSKRSVYDRGKTYTTVGNIMLGVGAVTFTTSVLLFVLTPTTSDDKPKKMALSIATFGDAPLGASLIGSF